MEVKKQEKKKDYASDRLSAMQLELKTTKYNKRTQGSVGLLKAKIARAKEDLTKRASSGKKGEGYSVKKSGDATVILVGFPSVGKSTLLNSLTNASSLVAAYAFTTLTVIPGTLHYKQAKIQILDVPGIVEGAASGRGRGREVLAVAQNADLALVIIDVFHPEHYRAIMRELQEANIRVNKQKPRIKIARKETDGLQIWCSVKLTKIDNATISAMMREMRMNNADIIIREDIDADDLIDVLEGNKRYIPSIVIINKVDLATADELKKIKEIVTPDLYVSAENRTGLEELRELIFEKLGFIRIYCKEVGKEADMEEPMILFKGARLKDMCDKLHREFVTKFKYSRIWGKSVKFEGQKILNLEHELKDKDIVEIHIK